MQRNRNAIGCVWPSTTKLCSILVRLKRVQNWLAFSVLAGQESHRF